MQALPAAQALDELFGAVAGLADNSLTALKGLLSVETLAEQRPTAVVVFASGAEERSPTVEAKLAELSAAAASSLQLPNAVHDEVSEIMLRVLTPWLDVGSGGSHAAAALHGLASYRRHRLLMGSAPATTRAPPPPQSGARPVFEAYRRSAKQLHMRLLGDCGVGMVRGLQPATAQALQQVLEGAAADASAPPLLVVVCPPAGDEAGEVELLGAAQALLSSLAPRHMMAHVKHPPSAVERAEQRRRLAAAAGGGSGSIKGSSGAERTSNYTTCDPTCRKHVSLLVYQHQHLSVRIAADAAWQQVAAAGALPVCPPEAALLPPHTLLLPRPIPGDVV